MKNYKIIFSDLDGTLIDTISGETFPKGIWDMKIKFDVLDKIKELNPLALFIVTNQGGIEKGFVNRRNFEFKMEYLIRAIKEYTGIYSEYSYCDRNDKTFPFRTPNIGMLDSCFHQAQCVLFRDENITKEDCLMIGDESGKGGQFSDTDKKTAENFGIDYIDVNEFILGLK